MGYYGGCGYGYGGCGYGYGGYGYGYRACGYGSLYGGWYGGGCNPCGGYPGYWY